VLPNAPRQTLVVRPYKFIVFVAIRRRAGKRLA
jgi:hypothetical protein